MAPENILVGGRINNMTLENAVSCLNKEKYCSNIKKIYAFEPDPQCYEQCIKQKEMYNYSEAEIFPFGTWSRKKYLHFNTRGDSCTHIAKTGQEILVMPIDEVINPKDRVTFIKMDIEGSELESLKGAKKSFSAIDLSWQFAFIIIRKI